MIPKIIHYCWFGRNPLPESAIKCINSWKKFFPDYEIKKWNEDNFDVNIIPYTKEAYEAKKYAFVSDYARFVVLEREGGLYFDTDVEVIRPMDDILAKGGFMGIEVPAVEDVKLPVIAPGLGLAVESGNVIYKELLEVYKTFRFKNEDGSLNQKTIGYYTTEILEKNGLRATNDIQEVGGLWIYPKEYFNPLDDNTGILNKTTNTRTIHWYSKTWIKPRPVRKWIVQRLHRIFGTDFFSILKKRF